MKIDHIELQKNQKIIINAISEANRIQKNKSDSKNPSHPYIANSNSNLDNSGSKNNKEQGKSRNLFAPKLSDQNKSSSLFTDGAKAFCSKK